MPDSAIRRYFKHGMLPQLRVFEASARLRSLTRAAEELHIAQPTVSVQMKKLSETIGLPLFEQAGRQVRLTEAGERLYAGCQDVFRAFSTLDNALDGMRAIEAGHLRLAVGSTAKYFAPRLLGAFIERYPGVEATLEIHNEEALLARLSSNTDDLYLVAAPIARAGVVAQVLLANPLVVMARNDHPLAQARRIALARIAEEPFLMREVGSGTRRLATEQFDRYGLTPKVRMELGSEEAIKEAILAGLGVSILSRHTFALEPEPPGLICLDVDGFPVENHWHFVYPVGKLLSVTARAFMDFSRLQAKALAAPAAGFSSAPGRGGQAPS